MKLTADSKKRVVLPGAAPGTSSLASGKAGGGAEANMPRSATKKAHKGAGAESDSKLESVAWHEVVRASEDDARNMICREDVRRA